jgi:hypothetical protein
VVEVYLQLRLILRIITYLTYICWEIDNFVIKSDIFKRFFICKNILKKLSCYHDNYFRYFMFGKYNGFVSKARVSACMYFLVIKIYYISSSNNPNITHTKNHVCGWSHFKMNITLYTSFVFPRVSMFPETKSIVLSSCVHMTKEAARVRDLILR